MTTTISKTTFTFVVLHPTDEPIDDIEVALSRSDTDNAVGLTTEVFTEEIPDDQVPDELVALNNDGEFFNFELGLEED